jgi:hypothetical protein
MMHDDYLDIVRSGEGCHNGAIKMCWKLGHTFGTGSAGPQQARHTSKPLMSKPLMSRNGQLEK